MLFYPSLPPPHHEGHYQKSFAQKIPPSNSSPPLRRSAPRLTLAHKESGSHRCKSCTPPYVTRGSHYGVASGCLHLHPPPRPGYIGHERLGDRKVSFGVDLWLSVGTEGCWLTDTGINEHVFFRIHLHFCCRGNECSFSKGIFVQQSFKREMDIFIEQSMALHLHQRIGNSPRSSKKGHSRFQDSKLMKGWTYLGWFRGWRSCINQLI